MLAMLRAILFESNYLFNELEAGYGTLKIFYESIKHEMTVLNVKVDDFKFLDVSNNELNVDVISNI